MSEWWEYRPSDFLLFAPRTYYRLIELYNAAWWPLHLLALALGVAILVLMRRGTAWDSRAAAASLAACWAWVAWAWLWRRYATINWAATWVAGAFVFQAAFMTWLGAARGAVRLRMRTGGPAFAGALLVVVGLAYPLVAPLSGRPVHQAEVFGLAPDPTVIVTLGVIAAADGRWRWALLVIPALWSLVSAVTLRTMGSPEWWVPALALLAALAAATRGRSRAVAAS